MNDSWHTLPAEEALERLGSASGGLSDADARRRLEQYGPNALRVARPVSAWKILLDQLTSVVVLLLFAAAAVALLIGDSLEAAAIAAVLVVNTLLGFITEFRARRAMEALLRMEVPDARVVRDGSAREIDARELVPGDVIRVEAGEAVPADARLLGGADLRTNEAALTGESAPVGKRPDRTLDEEAPLPERENMVYQSTTVVMGAGEAVVVATGMETELGRIGGLASGIAEERTPLEHRLDALGHRLIWVALAVAALVVGVGAMQGAPMRRMVEAGVALAIAAVPEGLPVVATIALAVGVRRMARRRALIRRLPSVESLGSVTVVCTDKTGTLTAGQMTVTTLRVAGREIGVTGTGYTPEGRFTDEGGDPVDIKKAPGLEPALRIGALANRAELARAGDADWTVTGDPTDAALLVAARKAGLRRETLLERWPEIGAVPFSSERQLMATFHRAEDGGTTAFVKGAPGRIVELCSRRLEPDGERPLDDAGRRELLDRNRDLAARGLRVLALATGSVERADESGLEGLTFIGFVGMIDPPASGVEETIRLFRGAGIRTVMLTGDQRLTAEAIARQLGVLQPGEEVLDGRELGRLTDAELADRVERVGAFSRVSPEAKLKIVTAFQRHGEVVAMLGDGVNDAVALKKADVGVAMGRRGTDVAKEAAAVVLQDDRFRTIGAAVEEGRAIFDNIRKFVFYLFSCNLAEVFALLGAGVAGLPLPLQPLQILWLNLVTDTFPALALAVEPGESDLLRRPPRDPEQAILSGGFVRSIAFYSALITAVTLGAFVWGLAGAEGGTVRAVTLSFMTLALAQTFHLGNARSPAPATSWRRVIANPWAIGAVVLVIGLQFLAVYAPPLALVLDTYPLELGDWLVVFPLALVPAVVGQGVKLARSRTSTPAP